MTGQSDRAFRIDSVGHWLFAAAMIWLGVWGLNKGAFVVVWNPVPTWVPAQTALAYLVAIISLASGVGLLFSRTAAMASRVLLGSLAAWIVILRLPPLFYQKPLVLVGWSFGATSVMAAGAWLLAERFAGVRGARMAQVLYGVSLIPFGLAHFMYLDATTVLIPDWLPFHVALAYLTGSLFVTAGFAVALDVFARLGAALSTAQMGGFLFVVWIPRVIMGNVTEFQFGEFVVTFALMSAGWVVTESLRGAPWFAPRSARNGK